MTGGHDGNRVKRVVARAGEVQVEVDIGQVDQLVVSELMAPGWQVSVDGKPREAERIEGLYRGVAVEPGDSVVRWHYRPPGLYWGIVLSGMALLVLAGVGHVRFWHPRWLDALDLDLDLDWVDLDPDLDLDLDLELDLDLDLELYLELGLDLDLDLDWDLFLV